MHGGEAAEVAQLRAAAQGQAPLIPHGDDGVLHLLGLLLFLVRGLLHRGSLGGRLFTLRLRLGLLGLLKEAALVAAGVVQDHVHQQQAARLPLRALGGAQLDHGGVIVLALEILGGLEILGSFQGDGLVRRQDGNVLPDKAGGFLHLQIRHHQDVNRPVGGLVGSPGRPGQALEGRLLRAVAGLVVSVLGDVESHLAQNLGNGLLRRLRLLFAGLRRLFTGLRRLFTRLRFALLRILRSGGFALLLAGILCRLLGKGRDRQRHQQGQGKQQRQGTLAQFLHGSYPPMGSMVCLFSSSRRSGLSQSDLIVYHSFLSNATKIFMLLTRHFLSYRQGRGGIPAAPLRPGGKIFWGKKKGKQKFRRIG